MREPRWLLKSAVLSIHNLMIVEFGGIDGLRDEGLLDSALARPNNLYSYERCEALARLAAAYTFGIIQNHPFLDGNKRTGFMCAYVFLGRNGLELRADEVSAATRTLALAASETDEAAYAEWLAQNVP
ncbi:MAG: death-on-curing protein [Gammaproteobacteria bacterium]|jgi:death-on-curing protein